MNNTIHVCPAEVVSRFERAMETCDVAWGLIANPANYKSSEGDVTVERPEYAMLNNGEYAGPIFFCPWCGERLYT